MRMKGSFLVAMWFGLVAGVLFLIGGRFLPGFFVLGLVVLLTSLRFASDRSTRLLIGSIAAVICGGVLLFYAVRSEITGRAVDYHAYGRVVVGRPVTRREFPEKFREATNYKWALGIVCVSIGSGGFMFRRNLDRSDLF